MRNTLLLLALMAIIGLWSCNSDPDDPTGPVINPDDTVLYNIPVITTDFGEIFIWLYDETPKHRDNFLKLANDGFFNGTTFHRIIDDFMIQGGDPNSKDSDPNNDGTGGPGYTIPAEINDELKHVHGALGAARLGDQVNPDRESSGSQFYIVENADGTPHLDGAYTVFGIAFSGLDAVSEIAVQPKTAGNNRPITDIEMTVEVRKITGLDLKEKYKFNP